MLSGSPATKPSGLRAAPGGSSATSEATLAFLNQQRAGMRVMAERAAEMAQAGAENKMAIRHLEAAVHSLPHLDGRENHLVVKQVKFPTDAIFHDVHVPRGSAAECVSLCATQ